jgi:hypothetical protein
MLFGTSIFVSMTTMDEKCEMDGKTMEKKCENDSD